MAAKETQIWLAAWEAGHSEFPPPLGTVYGHPDTISALGKMIADRAELIEALRMLVAKDANARINSAKAELFRLAPEIEAGARSLLSRMEK